MNERKELIERLRDYAYEGDPLYLMEQAADMLEADAQPAVPQEPVAWQPIETAPKDGSKVLLFWYGNNTKFISVAVWRGDKAPDYPWRSAETGSAIGGFGQCHLEEKERTWEQGATHWMPLPAPPLPDNAVAQRAAQPSDGATC